MNSLTTKVKTGLAALGLLILYIGLYPILIISGAIYLGSIIVKMIEEKSKNGKS